MSVKPRLLRPVGLDDFLLYRLSRLLGTAGTLVIRLCEGQYGITRREWRLLELLLRHAPVPPSRLAELAQLDRARTSRALSSLVAKKLVTRTTQPADRRQAVLGLTEAGHKLCASLLPQVRALNLELLDGLDANEVAVLDHVLDRLQARASELIEQHRDFPKADRRRGGRSRPALG